MGVGIGDRRGRRAVLGFDETKPYSGEVGSESTVSGRFWSSWSSLVVCWMRPSILRVRAIESFCFYTLGFWNWPGTVRDPWTDRCGGYGRGVEGARYQTEPYRCDQDTEAHPQRPFRAGGS